MYQYILFDLDGTLTDPGLGITNSVAYALKKMGIPVPERSELYKFIGPPLLDSFLSVFGLSREESEQAVTFIGNTSAGRASLKIRCTWGSRNFKLSCRKVGGR